MIDRTTSRGLFTSSCSTYISSWKRFSRRLCSCMSFGDASRDFLNILDRVSCAA